MVRRVVAEGRAQVFAAIEAEDDGTLGRDGLRAGDRGDDGDVGDAGGGEDVFGGQAVDLGAPGGSAVGSHQIMRRAAVWIFAAVLAVAVLTLAISAAVRFAATSTWWWERGFERFDAPGRTGLAAEEVSRIGAEVRAYFRDDEERLAVRYGGDLPFFSEREVQHMVDVKVLLARTWDAGWAAFGLLAAIAIGGAIGGVAVRGRFDCRAAARAAVLGGVAAAAIIGVLAVVAVSGFEGDVDGVEGSDLGVAGSVDLGRPDGLGGHGEGGGVGHLVS